MTSIFWDSKGVIMVDYFGEGGTINDAYYAEELRQLRQEIVKKRRRKVNKRHWELIQLKPHQCPNIKGKDRQIQ